MKKLLIFFIAFSLCSINTYVMAEPAHFVAWGDEEGVVKRPGTDLNARNEALPVLKKRLTELDKTNKIDGFLQVGDFVRFDPNESYYKDFLGQFIERFYPTSGGDQEFFMARYYGFINAVPHLKFLYLDRAAQDGNGLEYYYHTIVKNTHLISLYSPDEYRETDVNPQYSGQNFFENINSPQYKWLESLLKRIRTQSNDQRPIIILCHGPVFNASKLITGLFAQYKVNLVLGGDAHVLAHKSYKGTEYFISGMMGDLYLGLCSGINPKTSKDYIEDYDFCLPKEENGFDRRKEKGFIFHHDHYLDIMIDKDYLKVEAIDVGTGAGIFPVK
jgi:hypothetical protein